MKALKWIGIIIGIIIVVVIVALLVIPMFVDLNKFKPQIEEGVAEVTGRPFKIDGELRLSLFPWASLAFSGLHLGNPQGFQEKEFVSVKSFDARVKLLPLISRDIQVKRFVVEGPRIVLVRGKDGRGNWEGLAKRSGHVPDRPPQEKRKTPEAKTHEGLPIKSLAVGEFSITKGSLLWIDHTKGARREISDFTLRLQEVSLDRPIRLAFSAQLDGQPLSLEGKVGPLGKDPGKGTVPVDLALKALKELEMSLKGEIVDPGTGPQFDMALQVSPFSPRKMAAALGEGFPVNTADPGVLNHLALKATLKGEPQFVSISNGILELDDSKLKFSAKAKEFSRPDIGFDLNLDEIDLDRYLPAPSEKPAEGKKPAKAERKESDYTSLRRLVLDGTVRVGKMKARGAKIQDLYLKITGKNGRFRLDPLNLKLYQGDLTAKGILDVQKDTPKSNMELHAKSIQVAPLLQDFLKKDFLEGTFKADVAIRMIGDGPDRIKQTLNGKGDFLFNDGAIKGIDLAGMVRNIKAAFGLAEKGAERPRTDFSELHAPFTITNGVFNTPGTTMKSPFLRVQAAGKANLVDESLDFRVEPKFVGTIKGQGDTMQRAGIVVPVLVTGNFSSPKFRPDLEAMLKQKLEIGLPESSEDLEKLIPGKGQKIEKKELEETVKGLLKGFGQ